MHADGFLKKSVRGNKIDGVNEPGSAKSPERKDMLRTGLNDRKKAQIEAPAMPADGFLKKSVRGNEIYEINKSERAVLLEQKDILRAGLKERRKARIEAPAMLEGTRQARAMADRLDIHQVREIMMEVESSTRLNSRPEDVIKQIEKSYATKKVRFMDAAGLTTKDVADLVARTTNEVADLVARTNKVKRWIKATNHDQLEPAYKNAEKLYDKYQSEWTYARGHVDYIEDPKRETYTGIKKIADKVKQESVTFFGATIPGYAFDAKLMKNSMEGHLVDAAKAFLDEAEQHIAHRMRNEMTVWEQ